MRAALVVVLATLLAGCAQDAAPAPTSEPNVYVGPPTDGGGPAACAPQNAQQLAIDVHGQEVRDARGLAPGLHQTGATQWLWIWAAYHDTDRQDRVSRVNEVQVFRLGGDSWFCTRVELVAPTFTDGTRSSYAVGVQYDVLQALPPGPAHWTVNWVAGCARCDPFPSGNSTGDF